MNTLSFLKQFSGWEPCSQWSRNGPLLSYAVFSKDGQYRYLLGREWDDTLPALGVVILNPSNSGVEGEDPTTSKVMDFAKKWGFGVINVVSIYALIANPKGIARKPFSEESPQEPGLNEACWHAVFEVSSEVLIGWGGSIGWSQNGMVMSGVRGYQSTFNTPVFHLGLTKQAECPKHPLYLRKDTERIYI